MRISTKFKTFAFSFALLSALETSAKEFSYIENFDEPAVNNQADLPEGWIAATTNPSSPIKRYNGSYIGTGAHSSNAVLGTMASTDKRDDWAFSKAISLKKDTEYTVSFWLKAQGGSTPIDIFMSTVELKVGTAQDKEAMSISLGKTTKRYANWEEVTYKFTPTSDGDYYFGFNIVAQMQNAGAVAIDDFQITGNETDAGETDSDDKETMELPYTQSFDNKDDYHNSFLPKGWLATGSSTFVTANLDKMPARDGTYYLIAPESAIARDDRAYTPFFKLQAGVTYNAEFYLYMPGDDEYNEGQYSDFSFTVGTEQDSEFHTTTLLYLPNHQNTTWKKHTVSFTPTENGTYCFSFALGGTAVNAGEVCIDLFTLKAVGQISKPKANFAPDAVYSLMESNKIVAFKDSPVKMINYSTDGESYEWTATGATPETSTEKEPSFSFPADGSYSIKLKVKNAIGEAESSNTVNVKTIGDNADEQFAVSPYSPNDNQISRDYVMTYDTDANGYDYVTGFNHYYHKLAQKFSMPQNENKEYKITRFSFGCNYWQMTNDPNANDKQKPFSIVIYGDKNGYPDTENVLARQDMTIEEAFEKTTGNSTFELRNLNVKEPITFNATGSFYVSLEFDDNMTLQPSGSGLYRSFFALGAYRSQTKETSFFVMPEAAPDGSSIKTDGKFYPVDVYDEDLKGLGVQIMPWMYSGNKGTTEIAVAPNGKTAFAAYINENLLTVSGTKAGETVSVYDTTGKLVSKETATEGSTVVNLNVPAGLYIVTTPNGTQKLVKK